jgi:hypothetical protein
MNDRPRRAAMAFGAGVLVSLFRGDGEVDAVVSAHVRLLPFQLSGVESGDDGVEVVQRTVRFISARRCCPRASAVVISFRVC